MRYTENKEEAEEALKICKSVNKIRHDGHVERCFLPDGQIIDDCKGCPLLVVYKKSGIIKSIRKLMRA